MGKDLFRAEVAELTSNAEIMRPPLLVDRARVYVFRLENTDKVAHFVVRRMPGIREGLHRKSITSEIADELYSYNLPW